MPRPRRLTADLPPRMIRRARTRKDGSVWVSYYYRPKGTQDALPLGGDLLKAKAEWARLEGSAPVVGTFAALREAHRLSAGKTAQKTTQDSRDTYWKSLLPVFGHMRLDALTPGMMRLYFDKRSAKHAARHELLYLSAIFNWARSRDYLPKDAVNPMAGILRELKPPGGTGGRTVYVTDEMYAEVYKHAHPILQDYMDLLYLTGQRPGDVCAMTWSQIQDGHIVVRQRKTGAALRIAIVGQLRDTLDRVKRRGIVGAKTVLVDPKGSTLNRWGWIRDRFDEARAKCGATWQLRDLRAKAATDLEDMGKARLLLGHTTENMTRKYVQDRAGEVVQPLRGKETTAPMKGNK